MKRRVRAFLLVTRHWLRFVIDYYVCRACCKNGCALTNNDIMSFTLCFFLNMQIEIVKLDHVHVTLINAT
jgi:hypothetical protein